MHQQIQSQLSAYLDGELTQADHQRVRLHLEDCPDCREHARQLESLRRATREMQFIPPPEDRMSQLEQKISVRAPRLAGWLLLVGGLAVWMLYGLYLYAVSPRPMTWQEMTA
ncbi:MAG TPA: zf-HC2 domain-containing protein, partial [Candidatus Acidoferrales bacterium]